MAPSKENQPAIPQISVRLATATKSAFLAYSDSLELDHSEVAKLLVIRENGLRRLAALDAEGKAPIRSRQVRGEATPMPHVTVYLRSLKFTKQFTAYARSCGLKRTDALAWLLETELTERWLVRALQMKV
jgi:hypothetical protein